MLTPGGNRHDDRLGCEFQCRRDPADILAARGGDVALATSTTTDCFGRVSDQFARRAPTAGLDGSDEADTATVRLADENDVPDPGLLAHGDRELAQITRSKAVDVCDHHTIVGDQRRAPTLGPAPADTAAT